MAGYHLREIPKGVLGDSSKIEEEYLEFQDALAQENPLMALHELSDLIGAIEAYAARHNISLKSLIAMKEATQRAFKNGDRT